MAPPAMMLQQVLNKLTGEVEWMVVSHNDDDDDDGHVTDENGRLRMPESSEQVSEALTMTTYLDMLNDSARNHAYNLAIQKAVKSGSHVLDIGAGTGLLSMMAWRAMHDDALQQTKEGLGSAENNGGGSITACESFLPMFKLARKLLKENKVGAGVRLIHKRSDEMEVGIDLNCRADVLISEILDSELLGEGLIPTLRHAHENLLTPNARCVPHKATVYAQLVECEYFWRCCDLPGVESQLADGLVLAPCNSNQTQGRSTAIHVDPLSDQIQLLSEPFEVFTFELYKSPDDHGRREHKVSITRHGRGHALITWWVLQLDSEGHIFYSTAPKWIKMADSNDCSPCTGFSSGWCDHWKQFVWLLPGRGLDVSVGEAVVVTASHDSVSVSYRVYGSPMSQVIQNKNDRRIQNDYITAAATPGLMKLERIGVLGDKSWRSVVKAAADIALRNRNTALCAVLDDSLPWALVLAAVEPNLQVVAMFPGRCNHQECMDMIATAAKADGRNVANTRVLNKKAASLTFQDLEGQKIDVLLAEPYYTSCEGMLPWRLLRFWYERTQLTSFLSDNPIILPCKGILYGVAVNMPDLWKSRQCLEMVEGFDHRSVNKLIGACGRLPPPNEGPLLPYAVWQCGRYKELTDKFPLLQFDFSRPIYSTQGCIETTVNKGGLCTGIVLWIDWILDPSGSLVISTGPKGGRPSYWKQGVKLLSSPVQVDVVGGICARNLVKVAGSFDSSSGEVSINVSFPGES